MGKGTGNKRTAFWMYMQYFIKPKMEQKLGRRLKTADVLDFGLPCWAVCFTLFKHSLLIVEKKS